MCLLSAVASLLAKLDRLVPLRGFDHDNGGALRW
jgi:hypothetical protein